MPFVLLVVGAMLVISGLRGQSTQLATLVKSDFAGQGSNFLYWMVAMLLLGSLGYFEGLKSLSRALIALVVVVLFLSESGFFSKFSSSILSGGSTLATASSLTNLTTPLASGAETLAPETSALSTLL